MKIRIVHHRRRQRTLTQRAGISRRKQTAICMDLLREEFEKHPERRKDPQLREARMKAKMSVEEGDSLMGYVAAEQEALSELKSYPDDLTRILPTQLGNALRSFEESTGVNTACRYSDSSSPPSSSTRSAPRLSRRCPRRNGFRDPKMAAALWPLPCPPGF